MRPADIRPITVVEFARKMAHFAPFETKPEIAVAVSGGGDSLALAALAQAWAKRAGGQATALIVDHGLRKESPAEARFAARQLRARGMPAVILRWTGRKPEANRQEAAREARYRLLEDWCRRRGVLHLLVAHHADDQAETLLLRLARGSGLDGLAAMAAEIERRHIRVLRPLLRFPKSRLAATAARAGLRAADDPSNRDPAFARASLRRTMAMLGLDATRLAETAFRLGRARAALGENVARLLVDSLDVSRAPVCRLDVARLMAAPEEIGLRALARTLAAVGGARVTPRLEALERLYFDLPRIAKGGGGRTLGGCLIRPKAGFVEISPEKSGKNARLRTSGLALWPAAFAVV